MLRSLCLLCLPAALLTIVARGEDVPYDGDLVARDAASGSLSSQGLRKLAGMRPTHVLHARDEIPYFGEDTVDVSLDGYEHIGFTRDVEEGVARSDEAEGEGDSGEYDDEDDNYLAKGEELAAHQQQVEQGSSDEADLSLDDYGHDLDARDVGESEDEEEIDYTFEGYDEALLAARDLGAEGDEEALEDDLVPEETLTDKEYEDGDEDASVLAGRDIDTEGAHEPTSYEAEFTSKSYLQTWDAKLAARDLEVADEDSDYYEPIEPAEELDGTAKPAQGDNFLNVFRRWFGG